MEEQRKSVAQTAKKLDLLSEENSQLHAVNEDLRALVTTLRVKKSSLQDELAARREHAVERAAERLGELRRKVGKAHVHAEGLDRRQREDADARGGLLWIQKLAMR